MLRLGALALLFCMLGTVVSSAQVFAPQKISSTHGNFRGQAALADKDLFGSAVAPLGDIDDDDVPDLAVGAIGDNEGRGAVWVLFLDSLGTVRNQQKISAGAGGLPADSLDAGDLFGSAIANLGDIDDDPETVTALAVGAPGDDGGASNRGAVWILFLRSDGTVKMGPKISEGPGGLPAGSLDAEDLFGNAVANLGDVDGDGVPDLAVGAFGDDDGCPMTNSDCNRGAVWVLFLRNDGRVKSRQKISDTVGRFTGTLENGDVFGYAAAGLGDVNGDGTPDLAVGAYLDDDGGDSRGAAWVLFLAPDGTVRGEQKISNSVGDFEGELADKDLFGFALATLGDVDGDGSTDLAVGAPGDDDEGPDRGAAWVLFLNSDGTVRDEQKISDIEGAFETEVTLENEDLFGSAMAGLGDVDENEVADLAVGAPGDDEEEGLDRGALWVLFLLSNGEVRDHQKISAGVGGLPAESLGDGDAFGSAVANLGDLDNDPATVTALAVGAPGDDVAGGSDRGAVWVLFLDSLGTVKAARKISEGLGGLLPGSLDVLDDFGSAVAGLGDLDRDGVPDLAVGAPRDDDGSDDRGAVWVLFLRDDGTVKEQQKISATRGNFMGVLDDGDEFGSAVATLGDLDGDGVTDLAVGASSDDGQGINRGAVWIVFLNENGTVKRHQKISETEGFAGDSSLVSLDDNDLFGSAVANLGDLDNDPATVTALAVGAPGDDDGGNDQGAVWVLFLTKDGTVKSRRKISETASNFTGALDRADAFGSALARLEDGNGDGKADLAVGAPGDDDGGDDRGAVWRVFEVLNPPPVIQPPPRPSGTPPIVVSVVVSDGSGVSSVFLHYRSAGESATNSMLMIERSPNNYEGTLPANTRGIEYFIQAIDAEGATAFEPASGFRSIEVFVADGLTRDEPQPTGSDQTGYRLISVPLNLNNPSPGAVLEDDLGAYDDTRWLLWYWQPDVRDLVEFPDFPDEVRMAPGEAFFLIVGEEDQSITTGPGNTVRTDQPFAVTLQPGWNVFGNPFNFDIPLSKIFFRSTGQLPVLWFFDGAWNNSDLSPFEAINPFEGYAVFNASDTEDLLFIDPLLFPFGQNASPKTPLAQRQENASWAVRIQARSRQARDVDNVAKVAPGAAETWDRLDRAEPPPIGDYVSVYFPHPEWKNNTTRYSTDARPVPTDGVVWPFDVTTTVRDKVHLTFEGLADVPPTFEVWLVDDAVQTAQNLRETPTYTVAATTDPRSLKLVVGSRASWRTSLLRAGRSPRASNSSPTSPTPSILRRRSGMVCRRRRRSR